MTPELRRSAGGRGPWLVALAAAVVVVVVAAVALTLVLVPRADPEQEAATAAETFAVQMDTYDATRPQEFLDRMEPFLAPSYRSEFTALVTPLLDSLARVEQTSDRARVEQLDVVGVDGDRVRVELVVTSRLSRLGQVSPGRLPQAWRADLRLTDGRWLVEDFAFSLDDGGSGGQDDGSTQEA